MNIINIQSAKDIYAPDFVGPSILFQMSSVDLNDQSLILLFLFTYIYIVSKLFFIIFYFFPGGAGGREAQLDQESLVGLLRHDQVRDWLQPAGVQGLRLLLWLSWVRQHCGWY